MARIAGVNIPTNKRVEVALTYIFGIGRTTAADICKQAGIPPLKRVHDLSEETIARVRQIIDADLKVEGELRSEIAMNVKRLVD